MEPPRWRTTNIRQDSPKYKFKWNRRDSGNNRKTLKKMDFTNEAAQIAADEDFSHDIKELTRHPRLVVELLAEVGAELGRRTYLEEKIQRYLQISKPGLAVVATYSEVENAA